MESSLWVETAGSLQEWNSGEALENTLTICQMILLCLHDAIKKLTF